MDSQQSRRDRILRAVILEYVAAAEPVGSEMLAQKYEFGVRSATIRNELAELSDSGLLEQPHTSAGRVPSDLGYRYFVDRLIQQRLPSADERKRVQDVTESDDVLQSLLTDTARALSRITRLLTVATTLTNGQVKVRHGVVTALGADRALLVLVTSTGHVENRPIELPAGTTLHEIGQLNELLRIALEGQTLRSLVRLKTPAFDGTPAFGKFGTALWAMLRSLARDLMKGKLITQGEEFIFTQPEFERSTSPVRALFEALEQPDTYLALSNPTDDTVQVAIGRENSNELLRGFTILRRSFYVGENEGGTIALIGPTRLDYDGAIPLLQFTAQAISNSLTKVFHD